MSNADVNKTSNLIKSIAKAKDVYVDERLNLLIVRDSSEVVRLAEKLVAAANVIEPEVMLELEVMEVNVHRSSTTISSNGVCHAQPIPKAPPDPPPQPGGLPPLPPTLLK